MPVDNERVLYIAQLLKNYKDEGGHSLRELTERYQLLISPVADELTGPQKIMFINSLVGYDVTQLPPKPGLVERAKNLATNLTKISFK